MEANLVNALTYDIATQVPVMEHFYTLQGEGHHAGTPAYFIRLAGCDVGCHWCDVKESWTADPHQLMDIAAITAEARASQAPIAVITGGEPTMYDLCPLTRSLKEAGLKTHIETSGAHPFSGDFDWITLSPKKFKAALPEYFDLAHELKIIVCIQKDLQWAEEQAGKCQTGHTKFYLQPEWSKRERVDMMVDYILAHPHWHLSLQTHKYINIP